jgi:NTE family protein
MAKATKKVNLALQGGGAHGAYTWGVLDRLLEIEEIEIDGISGTSAGALNAAMLVNGYATGGREGAKACLEKFWSRISEAAAFSPLRQSPFERMFSGWNLDMSPMYHWFDFLSRTFSPYELNPLNINPMRVIVEDMLDLPVIHAHGKIKLFITATHVTSGQARVFSCNDVTADVLMASACIPFLFQAVEIEGEPYWDGGYMGNHAIWPLIYNCKSEDVILVQINPISDMATPNTASEIINRLNEITFNSSLIAEMRAIDFVARLLDQGKLDPKKYKSMRMHLIYSPEQMHNLNASSKMNANWDFFQYLRDLGRADAEEFINAKWNDVGVKSTLNIGEKFLVGHANKQEYYGDLGERVHDVAKTMQAHDIPQAVQKAVIKSMTATAKPNKKPLVQPVSTADQVKGASEKKAEPNKKKQVQKRK